MSADTLRDAADALKRATGQVWKIALEDAPGAPTLREKDKAEEEADALRRSGDPAGAGGVGGVSDAELETWPGKRSVA